MELSGEQRKKLQEALMDAFFNKALLEQMLSYKLEKRLDTIAGGSNLQEITFNLIRKAESEGWIEALVCAAHMSNNGNLKLQAITLDMKLNCQSPTHFKREVTTQDSVIFEAQSGEKICEHSDILNKYASFKSLEFKHNYPNLLFINIQIICLNFEKELQQVNLLLDISFGEVEENFKYKENLGFVEKQGYIRFGIKFGELCFKLTNGCMPLNLRKLPTIEQAFGLVSPTGTDEYPRWQFRVDDKKRSTLFGYLTNQELGIMSLQDTSCLVEATFQVNVNSNNLGVTEQEGVWDDETNKKVKQTKLRAFFKKVVEPKLKDYVSKVVLQYDSTTNS